MGGLQKEPSFIPTDLKVKILDASLVFPSQEIEKRSMFLSNVDQVLNFDVQTVHFFSANPEFPPQTVAEKLKNALADAMVAYDFLAGRLRGNPDSGRLEFDCNAAGAGFVVASSDYSLDEIGDLVYPNPAFAQLVSSTIETLPKDDKPLCVLQVTSFKCGGFALGLSTNHATFDGLSFRDFLKNLAALSSGRLLAMTPCNDRHLLAARSPPRVTFPHPELVELPDSTAPVFEATAEELDFEIFKLAASDIDKLKDKAKKSSGEAAQARISSFNAITALIWRCKALSFSDGKEEEGRDAPAIERESTILYAVDVRPRLNPPLPASYTGNAVLTAYAKAKCKDLRDEPFFRLVEMVGEGSKRMTDEYARSVIDWGEIHKGFPHGEVLVSSWWKLGFAEVEYPWGKPKYSCPVVYHRKDIILLFPDIDTTSNGVNVLVALPRKEMDKFQSLFLEFLAD